MTEGLHVAGQVDALAPRCPICSNPLSPSLSHGYVLDGEREATCEPCHATLMQIVLESQLGMHQSFLTARKTDTMRRQIHRGALDARGLPH